MKEKFSPYRGDLSLDRIREELKANTGGFRGLPVLLIAATLPFVLIGGFMLLHGEWNGLIPILGPAAITGAIYYIEQRMRKKAQEKLWRFDHGEYSPRTMLVTGKRESSGGSDGEPTYYLSLRQEGGSCTASVSVQREEYDYARMGEVYYAFFIQGSAPLCYGKKYYSIDPELQAIFDGEKAISVPDASPTRSDSKPDRAEEESAREKTRHVLRLNTGMLAFLAAYGIAALVLALNKPFFSALQNEKKALLVLAVFSLLWGVYFICNGIRRNWMKTLRTEKESDNAQERKLFRAWGITTLLFWLEHILLFLVVMGWFR